MQELDPKGLERRKVGIKNKKRKECFTTKGPNWVHSVDGHNKLMGFQSDTFPLLFMEVLTQSAENFCGFISGQQIKNQN